MLRARNAHAAAQSAPQQRIGPPAPGRSKPSLAPTNITTASGASRRVWRAASSPQSASPSFDSPVPTCGSRSTSTPSPTSRRASSASSGIESESPVTSSLPSGRFAGAASPSCAGSNDDDGTAGTAGARRPRAAERAGAAALVVLEEGERVVGRLVERQPVGDPSGGRAHRAQHVALGARLLVLARVPDRRSLEQHEQEHGEQHDDHRVARGQPAAGRRVEG